MLPEQPPHIVVTFDPPSIQPGDTALVILRRRTVQGILESYPGAELFDVSIVNGWKYGLLLSATGDTERYLNGTTQGFKLIAADSLDSDSATVILRVAFPGQPGRPGSGRAIDNEVRGMPTKEAIQAKRLQEHDAPAWYADGAGVGREVVRKCPFGRPSDAIMTITQQMVTVLPENDYLEMKEADDAVTRMKNNTPHYLISDQRYHSGNQGLLALLDFVVEIEWGLNFRSYNPSTGYNYVDENLSGINSQNKARALEVLRDKWGPKFGGAAIFWLIEASRAHERVHLEQMKKFIPAEYNKALQIINNQRLPPDYCRKPPAEIAGLLTEMHQKAEDAMRKARVSFFESP